MIILRVTVSSVPSYVLTSNMGYVVDSTPIDNKLPAEGADSTLNLSAVIT